MKNYFLGVSFLSLLLSGCGAADGVANMIGQVIVDTSVLATACPLVAVWPSASSEMDLYIIQEDLSRLQSQIREQKISKTADFWKKISAQDVSDLHAWVKEGFEKLSEKNRMQKVTLKDFEALLVHGLISATEKNTPAGTYNFSQALLEKSGNAITLGETYMIRLKVYGAPNEEAQNFQSCTLH